MPTNRTTAITAVITVLTTVVVTSSWGSVSSVFVNAALAGDEIPKIKQVVGNLELKANSAHVEIAVTKQRIAALHDNQSQIVQRSQRIEEKMDRMLEIMLRDRQ